MTTETMKTLTLCDTATGYEEAVNTEAEADELATDWARDSGVDAVLYGYFSRQRALDSRYSYAVTQAIQEGKETLYELKDEEGDTIKRYTLDGVIETFYAEEIASFGTYEKYFEHMANEYDLDDEDA